MAGKYGYHEGDKYWNVRDGEGQFAKGAGSLIKKIADLKLPAITGNYTAVEKKNLRAQRRKLGQKMIDNGHPPAKIKEALSADPKSWPALKDIKTYSAEKPKAPAGMTPAPELKTKSLTELRTNKEKQAPGIKKKSLAQLKAESKPGNNLTKAEQQAVFEQASDIQPVQLEGKTPNTATLAERIKMYQMIYGKGSVKYKMALQTQGMDPKNDSPTGLNGIPKYEAIKAKVPGSLKFQAVMLNHDNLDVQEESKAPWNGITDPTVAAHKVRNELDGGPVDKIEALMSMGFDEHLAESFVYKKKVEAKTWAEKAQASPPPPPTPDAVSSTPLTVAGLKLPSIEGEGLTAVDKKKLRSKRRAVAQAMIDNGYPASVIKADLGSNPDNWPDLADIKKAGPIKPKAAPASEKKAESAPVKPTAKKKPVSGTPETNVANDAPSTPKVTFPPKPAFFGGTQEEWENNLKKQEAFKNAISSGSPPPATKPGGMTAKPKVKVDKNLGPAMKAVNAEYAGSQELGALFKTLKGIEDLAKGASFPDVSGLDHYELKQQGVDFQHKGLKNLLKSQGMKNLGNQFPGEGADGVIKTTLLNALNEGSDNEVRSAIAYASYHGLMEDLLDHEGDYGSGANVEAWSEAAMGSVLSKMPPDSEALYSLLSNGWNIDNLTPEIVAEQSLKASKPAYIPGGVNLKAEAKAAFEKPSNKKAFDDLPDAHKAHLQMLGGQDEIAQKFEDTPWARSTSATKVEDLEKSALQAFSRYTGSSYKAINGGLRRNKELGQPNQQAIDRMTAELDKSQSKEDLTLVRGVDADPGMLRVLGMDKGTTMYGPGFLENLQGRIGTSFQDKGFGSSSYQNDNKESGRAGFVAKDKINMRILAPKGTKMMNIKSISQHPNENEVLLQRGTSYTIANAYKDSQGFLWMDVVVTGQDTGV